MDYCGEKRASMLQQQDVARFKPGCKTFYDPLSVQQVIVSVFLIQKCTHPHSILQEQNTGANKKRILQITICLS